MQEIKVKKEKQPKLQRQTKGKQRILRGVVVSDKMQKTVVVEVNWLKIDRKYKRRYRQTKRYQAHDSEEKFKVGERVSIIECRPISKEKRWRVIYEKAKN